MVTSYHPPEEVDNTFIYDFVFTITLLHIHYWKFTHEHNNRIRTSNKVQSTLYIHQILPSLIVSPCFLNKPLRCPMDSSEVMMFTVPFGYSSIKPWMCLCYYEQIISVICHSYILICCNNLYSHITYWFPFHKSRVRVPW